MGVACASRCWYSASAVRKIALGVCGGRGVSDARRSSQTIRDSPGSQVAVGEDGEITRSALISLLVFATIVQAEAVEANNIERRINHFGESRIPPRMA